MSADGISATPLADVAWLIRDYVFPTPRPLSKTQQDEETNKADREMIRFRERIGLIPAATSISGGTSDPASAYLDQCSKLVEEEDSRRQSIDSRLTSILGLSSIAGTIVFSGILAEAAGTLRSQSAALRWIMAVGSLYLALQICAAILAAVRGLEKRGYRTPQPSDLIPAKDQALSAHVHERIEACGIKLLDDRNQNNSKLDQMIAGHQAMKNFVAGLILVALFGSCFAAVARPSGDLIDTLRKNRDLTEMLRGPKGDPGPPGVPGPPGAPSTPCASRPNGSKSKGHKHKGLSRGSLQLPPNAGAAHPPCK